MSGIKKFGNWGESIAIAWLLTEEFEILHQN
jgi:Holliday junction resolvase-like predicted endonuclease